MNGKSICLLHFLCIKSTWCAYKISVDSFFLSTNICSEIIQITITVYVPWILFILPDINIWLQKSILTLKYKYSVCHRTLNVNTITNIHHPIWGGWKKTEEEVHFQTKNGWVGSNVQRCSLVSQQEGYHNWQLCIQNIESADPGFVSFRIHRCHCSTIFWPSDQMWSRTRKWNFIVDWFSLYSFCRIF